MTAAAMPKLARLAVGASSPATVMLHFKSFNHGCTVEQSDFGREVSVGTLSNNKARVVANRRLVRPRLVMEPSLAEWRALLPWVFYGTEAGEGPYTYALGGVPVAKVINFDDTVKKWEMTGVAVARATIRARAGTPAELELDLLGIDFSNPGSFASFPAAVHGTPFIFKSLGLTIGGTATKCDDFSLTIDYDCDPDRFFNSETHAGVVPRMRNVSLSATVPWGAHHALWDAGADADGAAVAVALNGAGGSSVAFAMPTVKSQQNPHDANVPNEIMYPWEGMVLSNTAANDELVATVTLPT